MKWISIEDRLPESGLKVSVHYKNSAGKGRTVYAFYAEKHTVENHGDMDGEWCDYREDQDCYYLPVGWHEVIDNWEEYSSVVFDSANKPTHWTPLLEPPKED